MSQNTGDTLIMSLNSFFNFNEFYKNIFDQIEQAFNNKSDIAGTIHGQRKIYQGCFGRNTALFPSTKCNGSIPVESRLELAHAICLEQDPQVKQFRTQSLKIPLSQNKCSYPDFLIETNDNNFEVHEVKPCIKSLPCKDIERFERLSTIFSSIGITFKLVDKTILPSEKQLQHLLYLYQRGHRHQWNRFEINFALEQLQKQELHDINQAHKMLKDIGLKEELGDYLLFHKKISIPFNKPALANGSI